MNSRKKNRKWHWIFWGIYLLVNHLIFAEDILSLGNLFINLIFVLHNAGTAYVILDWWIPKFYRKQQYLRFIGATFLTIIFFAILLAASLYPIFMTISEFQFDSTTFLNELGGSIFWSNFSGITALVIPYFVLQRVELERRNNQLTKEKLESELQLLKSQLHPHFLFNALNNIYFLIKKDPDTAAEALAGFSNLLRFQLYEANNPEVSLSKEMDYLQQFAEIAQLRKGENFEVNWQLPTHIKDIKIAPLLLMPLVENAFKHSPNKNGQIDIQLKLMDKVLVFTIANNKELDKSLGIEGYEEGGIGLANIQKRLQLIYPDRHHFSISHADDQFVVNLMLELPVILTKKSLKD